MTHENKNIGGGQAHTEPDERKVAEMLGGLKRVEAPGDFDFHLKARILKTRPADYRRASLLPILKYAMPMALFLVVGAGLVLNGWYTNWRSPDLTVSTGEADNKDPVPVAPDSGSVPISVPSAEVQPSRAAPLPQLAVKAPSSVPIVRPDRDDPVRGGAVSSGGSRLMGGGNENIEVRRERGFEANNSNTALVSSPILPVKPVTIRDALRSIGIEAELENGTWKVSTVKTTEIAGRMGVRPGDRVESIDGQAIDGSTTYKDGAFKVKSMRVTRDGKATDLEYSQQPN